MPLFGDQNLTLDRDNDKYNDKGHLISMFLPVSVPRRLENVRFHENCLWNEAGKEQLGNRPLYSTICSGVQQNLSSKLSLCQNSFVKENLHVSELDLHILVRFLKKIDVSQVPRL